MQSWSGSQQGRMLLQATPVMAHVEKTKTLITAASRDRRKLARAMSQVFDSTNPRITDRHPGAKLCGKNGMHARTYVTETSVGRGA